MECPGCGASGQGGRFCIACGTPLPRRCPACAGSVPPQARFCPECGERLEAAAPPRRQEPVPSEAERRQLTILFCDLVGSTRLAAQLDPEDMSALLGAYRSTVAAEIARFEGHVAKFMGDGVLAYFGYPRAHEDEAERAVRAGLGIADAVARLATAAGEPLAVRIGIATGLVVVGELIGEGAAQEQSVIGETPNLAARLQAVAAPGSVIIGEATRRLLGRLFELVDLGPQNLKGFAAPVPAWRVAGMGTAESRFEALHGAGLTPLVGREHELGLLLDRWERAKEGRGQVVLLSGEPGIGKSRLTQALQERLAAEPHARLRYYCSPYHVNSALWPVIQQLRRDAGIADGDTPEVKLDKLEALLAGAGDAGHAAPLLAELLGLEGEARYGRRDLSPEMQRARTLEALVDHLLGLAARQPVLVVLEDVYWIDPTTRELIAQYLDRIADRRILILLISRPDQQPDPGAHLSVTRLDLNRLGRGSIEAMIGRLSEGALLAEDVIDAIVARTDGVPLFVEELTKSVLETREATIPASLHDSLMARLDHLPEVKGIAQTAACIGREFDYRLLVAVADRPGADLRVALDQLAAAGLIVREGTPPEAHYTFKHALVRDAAYESLLRSRRQQMHARIMAALETERPGSTPELLAHHATGAGLTGKAIDYWQQAGETALLKSAYREAVAHLTSAIELVGGAPDSEARRERELALQVQLGQALIACAGYADPATRRTFDRAHELLATLYETELRLPVLYGSWVGHYVRGESELSLVRAKEFLAVAETEPGDAARLIAHRVAGTSYVLLGEFAAGRHHLETSLSIYDPERHRALSPQVGLEPGVSACCYLAWTMWLLGFPDQARVLLERAAALGRDSTRINAIAYRHVHSGLPAMCWRDPAMVEHHGTRLAELASEHRFSMWHGLAATLMAWAAMELGRPQEAVAGHERGLAALASTGTRLFVPFMASSLARSLAACGRGDEATRVIETAIADSDATAQHWCAAELWRVRGELCLARTRDHGAEAELSFERALALARAQAAKSWQLRAATSLARLWADRGEPRQARDLLAPVYGWFTEGFDTADLKDAKALLDELT